MTAADRTAALSRLIHDEFLALGGLADLPQCPECVALSGLLTGLVQLARQGGSPESIEQLVAEAAETLGLIEESEPAPNGLLRALGRAVEQAREDRQPATTESMADATTGTRLSIFSGVR